jgi:hypothetical protein
MAYQGIVNFFIDFYLEYYYAICQSPVNKGLRGGIKGTGRRILWIESPDLSSPFRHDRAKKEEE